MARRAQSIGNGTRDLGLRALGRLRFGLACLFGIGKHQPAQSGHAISAASNDAAGDDRRDRDDGRHCAPISTALSIALLPAQLKATQSERFISELGMLVGGLSIKLAVVLTASSLLLFASNTAIIGCYHVFLALVKGGFLPKIIAVRNGTFNTPHIAVGITTAIPVLVILLSGGEMKVLGDMYAFGLWGAFVFSSLSLDSIRWLLGRRDFAFGLGVLTTAMVIVAWAVNLVEKHLATYFGGAVTAIGMLTAIGVRRAWFVDLLVQIPFLQRLQARA